MGWPAGLLHFPLDQPERRRHFHGFNHQAPPAEWRPDQPAPDSLPPYDILDALPQQFVVDGFRKIKIVQKRFVPAVVNDVLNKVTFTEFKRWQVLRA